MAEESAKLRIPYIAAAQAQKHVTHNEAMTLLDTLVQLNVLDKDLLAPPSSPAEGDCYIVAGGGGSATGDWIGWEKRVARYIDGTWRSYLPGQGNGSGWLAWVQDEDAMYRFDGADWSLAGIEGPQGPQGPAYQPDAAVDAIAGRSVYDAEVAGFSVLVVADSSNSGKPTLYFKLSASSADWSSGITWLPEVGGPAFTVRAATTADVVIATALNAGDTIDGVTLTAGDLVLVRGQAVPAENGVYTAGASPARIALLSTFAKHPGALVTVQEGTLNGGSRWQCISAPGGTIDVDPLTFIIAGVNVGEFFWWPGPASTVPGNSIVLDGMTEDVADYPQFWEHVQAKFSVVTAGKTDADFLDNQDGTLDKPDLTGANRFVRAADGTTILAGGLQADAAPDITGTMNGVVIHPAGGGTGLVQPPSTSGAVLGTTGGHLYANYSFAASASNAIYGAAAEVRPANIGMTPCMRAFA